MIDEMVLPLESLIADVASEGPVEIDSKNDLVNNSHRDKMKSFLTGNFLMIFFDQIKIVGRILTLFRAQ